VAPDPSDPSESAGPFAGRRFRVSAHASVAAASAIGDTSVSTNYSENPKIASHRTDAAIERVLDALDAFQRVVAAQHAPELTELTLTFGQVKAIYLVASTGPMRMSDLAAQLGTAPSTASGLVDRLVQMGLLERSEDPTNRRQVLVRATPAALEQLDAMNELNRDRLRQLLARFTDPDDISIIERAFVLMTQAARDLSKETDA
jgi:DNA-binding MarR family transcriptional regulator